jgi:hypothetical protein
VSQFYLSTDRTYSLTVQEQEFFFVCPVFFLIQLYSYYVIYLDKINSKARYYLKQRFSLANQRDNGASILGSLPNSPILEEIFCFIVYVYSFSLRTIAAIQK